MSDGIEAFYEQIFIIILLTKYFWSYKTSTLPPKASEISVRFYPGGSPINGPYTTLALRAMRKNVSRKSDQNMFTLVQHADKALSTANGNLIKEMPFAQWKQYKLKSITWESLVMNASNLRHPLPRSNPDQPMNGVKAELGWRCKRSIDSHNN